MPLDYEITLQEALDERWKVWFEGMTMSQSPSGGCMLCGTLPDKAALHSLLARIYDLNLTLVSLKRVEPGEVKINKKEAKS
jgi:hypothetical protein